MVLLNSGRSGALTGVDGRFSGVSSHPQKRGDEDRSSDGLSPFAGTSHPH